MPCLLETISEIDEECKAKVAEIRETVRLAEIIVLGWQLGRLIAVKIIEETLNTRGRAKTEWGRCEKCGKRLQSKGFGVRQIKSLIGVIRWERRRGRCPAKCVIGQIAPLDEAIGLQANQRSDAGLQRMACLMAIFVPFETAQMLLEQLSGVTVSSQTIWQWVQEVGRQMMNSLQAELAALEKGVEPEIDLIKAEVAAQILLIGADGVMVPFRPAQRTAQGKTKWREVKVAIFARLGKRQTRAGDKVSYLHHHRVAAVLGNIDQLAARMRLEALKQGAKQAPQVLWLSDGARGFWRLFEQCFSSYATGVLDFYHASQNLWRGIKGWLDGRTQPAKTWFAQARHRLRHGQADVVLTDIETLLLQLDLSPVAHQSLTRLYHYLDKHRDHIHYHKLKQAGLPIGSGFVESTCKWLIQQRFKGVGMRWSEDGFNHLLHLRLAWVNGRFDLFFDTPIPSPKF